MRIWDSAGRELRGLPSNIRLSLEVNLHTPTLAEIEAARRLFEEIVRGVVKPPEGPVSNTQDEV